MAIVYVLMIGFALFSDLGIAQNIVQSRRGDEPAFLNTAWTVQVLRGIVIWVLALLVAAMLPAAAALGWLRIGTVYADTQLPWIIAVFSITAVVAGFESTKILVARRNIQMRQITQIELLSQVIALAVMAALAWWTHSIWALVAGAILAATVRCVMSHLMLAGEHNRFGWERSALKELLGFGKWIFVSSTIGFLVINGDRLLLGGLVDTQTLGLYSIAFLLVNALSQILNTLAGNVFFPAMSQVVRERPHDLAAVSNKFQRFVDLFLMTASGILIAAGSTMVTLLYDSRYRMAGPILSTLAIGSIGMRYVVAGQCYLAMGKPQIIAVAGVLSLLVLYIGLPVAFHFHQFQGALLVIVLSSFSGWPLAIYFKIKHGLLDIKIEMLALPALAVGLILGLVLRFLLSVR